MIRTFWRELCEGVLEHYPLCCVVRYSMGIVAGNLHQAIDRGVTDPHGDCAYVPCGIFHHGVPWAEINDAYADT